MPDSALFSFPTDGVYEATLEEDFIDTAKALGKPYLKARHKFNKSLTTYPYTFVPENFFLYPLKKGDTVYVWFPLDNDTNFPVLWAAQSDFPTDQIDDVALPPAIGDNTDIPDMDKAVSVLRVGVDHYIISTATITVERRKTVMHVWSDKKFYILSKDNDKDFDVGVQAGQIELVTTDGVKTFSFTMKGGDVKIDCAGLGTFEFKNGTAIVAPNAACFVLNSVPMCPMSGLVHGGNKATLV